MEDEKGDNSASRGDDDLLMSGMEIDEGRVSQLPAGYSTTASRRTSASVDLTDALRNQVVDDLLAGVNGGVGQVVPQLDAMPMGDPTTQKLTDTIAQVLSFGIGVFDTKSSWRHYLARSIGTFIFLAFVYAVCIYSIVMGFATSSSDCSSNLVVFLRVQGIFVLSSAVYLMGWKLMIGTKHPLELSLTLVYLAWLTYGAYQFFSTDYDNCDNVVYLWTATLLICETIVYSVIFVIIVYILVDPPTWSTRLRRDSFVREQVPEDLEIRL